MFITKKLLTSLKMSPFSFFDSHHVHHDYTPGGPDLYGLGRGTKPRSGNGDGTGQLLISTIPYGCVKLAYATLGAIVGGFTYVLTGANADAAGKIWNKSMNGTYVLTPAHLAGKEPILFFGDQDTTPPSE